MCVGPDLTCRPVKLSLARPSQGMAEMTTVNMLEAKTNLSKLVESVETGREAEIVIARNGKPVARIVRLADPQVDVSKRLGIADGEFGEWTREMAEEWDRDNREMWARLLDESGEPSSRRVRRRNRR